jgi:hypothetical protein
VAVVFEYSWRLRARPKAATRGIAGPGSVIALLAAALLAAPISTRAEESSSPLIPLPEVISDFFPEDFTRPQSNFTVKYREKTSDDADEAIRTLLFQLELIWDLSDDWRLNTLAELPLTLQSPDASEDSRLAFHAEDTEFQLVAAKTIDERWGYAFGARFIAPTTDDDLGRGKFQVLPQFGVRYSLLEFGANTFFAPRVRFDFSVGGDSADRYISELHFAPTLNIELPHRCFVTLFPSFDVRLNFGGEVTGQTGALFLPLDVAVGCQVTDWVVLTAEASAPIIDDYPLYDSKFEFRVTAKF